MSVKGEQPQHAMGQDGTRVPSVHEWMMGDEKGGRETGYGTGGCRWQQDTHSHLPPMAPTHVSPALSPVHGVTPTLTTKVKLLGEVAR